jgi:YbbR domain-containing protein
MDKLFKSSWFIKIISFLIALMLYTMVATEQPAKNSSAVLLGNMDQSATLNENLDAKYDKNKEVLLGLPDSVQVHIKGNSQQILKTKFTTTRKVFIDLTGKGPGTYRVSPQTSGFPAGIKYSIAPSAVTVTLQKKVTRTLPVSVDLINKDQMKNGYKLGNPVLKPNTVTVTGGQKMVDAISFVKGIINVKDVTGPVNQQVSLNAYDENGNQLDVNLSPSDVRVTIPVESPSKVVPIDVKITGTPPDGKSVQSVNLSNQTVKLYGSHDVIDNIDSIHDIPLDLGSLDKNNQVQIKVPVPNGAEKVEPDTITATVVFGQTVTRTLADIPIVINDSPNSNKNVTFGDPKGRTVNVVLSGSKQILDQVKPSDIQVLIDISSLSPGKHIVPLTLVLPNYVDGVLSQSTATISISGGSAGP